MAELYYNSQPGASTGLSPFEIVHGYPPTLPVDLRLGTNTASVPAADHLMKERHCVWERVQNAMKKAQLA